MKRFVIILFCVLLAGCTEVPSSGIQSELELDSTRKPSINRHVKIRCTILPN